MSKRDIKSLEWPLFSPATKYVGIALVLMGVVGLYCSVYMNIEPEFLDFKVFTIYSQYVLTKIFTLIKNNQGDEISTLLYFIGVFLISASRKKHEQQRDNELRIKSLALTTIIQILLFLVGYFLLHGLAIVGFAVVLIYLSPWLYFLVFFLCGKKNKNTPYTSE